METIKRVPAVTHYPRTAEPSIEALRRLSGVVALTRPVPPVDFFSDEEDEDQDANWPEERAGD